MPVERTMEEVREEVRVLHRHVTAQQAEWEKAVDNGPQDEIAKSCQNLADIYRLASAWLDDVLRILEPKPLSLEAVIDNGIADPNRIPVLEVQLHTRDGWRRMTVEELRTSILASIKSEHYSITYDGKPTQPKSNPVVDTGEDSKVQLAKQINTLAKLLEAMGYKYDLFTDALRVLGSEACMKGLLWMDGSTDPTSAFAASLNTLYRCELPAFTAILSVLRDQFILSTDITLAIDRLNELVSLVYESEGK